MNFTKILTQLNHVDIQNRQIDHKFMTSNTFEKKYKTKQIQQIVNAINPSQANNNAEKNKTLLKQAKHRYFQDIEEDEIEDAHIFGYSTFEYFKYFKKNEAKMNRMTRRQAQKQAKSTKFPSKSNKPHFDQDQQSIQGRESTNSFIRPKTALVSRGTPTRRRVHHKLSLNQIEKVATSQNPLPLHIKQQYFTQEFFDFKPSQASHPILENVRCDSRTGTFYKQFQHGSSLHESKQKKSQYHFINENDKHPKRHLMFEATKTNFYEHPNNSKNLVKKKRRHLDPSKINDQKSKFSRGISCHFDNLTKKALPTSEMSETIKFNELKSVVYQRQPNNRKANEELLYYTQSIKQKQLNPRYYQTNSKAIIFKAQNQRPLSAIKPKNQFIQQNIFQSQLITQPIIKQPQTLKQIKLPSELSIFHSTNSLLLQRSQLTDLQFKYDNHYTPLHYSLFDHMIVQNINNYCTQVTDFKSKSLQHFNFKSFSKLPKQKPKLYNFVFVLCQTLEWVKFDNVELKSDVFVHKQKQLSLLLVAQKLMRNNLPSDFVHVMITRNTTKDKSETKGEQVLVFQTFIHNSDIKYFQGRQIQIQYFKYFLKRFITFDQSILKKDQIQSSVSLILQSEVKTPPEFEDFCNQMKIKDNLNIVALRNLDAKDQEVTFRCIEISLSKLLIDANQTVMMVKKELFEGYDWRGVSLTKGTKQYRGYHLEHFYI